MVLIIRYTKNHTKSVQEKMVALFEESEISEEEVKEIIASYIEEHDKIAFMSEKTYNSVFKSII